MAGHAKIRGILNNLPVFPKKNCTSKNFETDGKFLRFAGTVRLRGMGTGISEASKRVPIFSFATQGGKQVSSHFRQRNWVQAREAQIRFPAG